MPKTIPVEVRVADLPQMERFTGSVAALLKALAKCDVLLPEPVMAAAEQVRQAVAALGGKDAGPAPGVSGEQRIRAAMDAARENPGRTVTVD